MAVVALWPSWRRGRRGAVAVVALWPKRIGPCRIDDLSHISEEPLGAAPTSIPRLFRSDGPSENLRANRPTGSNSNAGIPENYQKPGANHRFAPGYSAEIPENSGKPCANHRFLPTGLPDASQGGPRNYNSNNFVGRLKWDHSYSQQPPDASQGGPRNYNSNNFVGRLKWDHSYSQQPPDASQGGAAERGRCGVVAPNAKCQSGETLRKIFWQRALGPCRIGDLSHISEEPLGAAPTCGRRSARAILPEKQNGMLAVVALLGGSRADPRYQLKSEKTL